MRLLVDALAAYRLTRLVTTDEITEEVRARVVQAAFDRAGVTFEFHPEQELVADALERYRDRYGDPPKLATLVTCRWCTGVWTAFGVVALRRLAPRAWAPVAEALALASAAALVAGLER